MKPSGPLAFGRLVSLSAVAMCLLTNISAHAWNSLGHRVVAEVAWRSMLPKRRCDLTALLRHHPHYTNLLTSNIPAGLETNHWAFLTAAVWPDLVRPAKSGKPLKPEFITRYNVHPHGVEWPFLLKGDTNFHLLTDPPVLARNAHTSLVAVATKLHDPSASLQDRAVSLCWVLHLVGDLHQPLHCANVVTRANRRERAFGGQLLVRDCRGEVISMHAFWDRLPGEDLSFAAVTRLVNALVAEFELHSDRLREYETNRTIASWVDESHRIAVEFAYDPERIRWVRADAVASGKIPKTNVPFLSAKYLQDAETIARQRLALAGARAAEVLINR